MLITLKREGQVCSRVSLRYWGRLSCFALGGQKHYSSLRECCRESLPLWSGLWVSIIELKADNRSYPGCRYRWRSSCRSGHGICLISNVNGPHSWARTWRYSLLARRILRSLCIGICAYWIGSCPSRDTGGKENCSAICSCSSRIRRRESSICEIGTTIAITGIIRIGAICVKPAILILDRSEEQGAASHQNSEIPPTSRCSVPLICTSFNYVCVRCNVTTLSQLTLWFHSPSSR
jgi:hypothetical protein